MADTAHDTLQDELENQPNDNEQNADQGAGDGGNDSDKSGDTETKPDMVPAEQYHNLQGAVARERRQRQELSNQVKVMEERFQKLLDAVTKRDDKQPVSYDDDPMGAIHETTRKTAESVKSLEEKVAGTSAAEEQRAREIKMVMQIAELADEFTKRTPDYPQAFAYYRDNRLQALQADGLSKAEAVQQLETEMRDLSEYSLKHGWNPAEQLYGLARARGYEKAAPADEKKPDEKDKDGGDAGEHLKDLEKNISNSKSLGSGASPSLTDMANMSDDEFDQAMAEMGFKN